MRKAFLSHRGNAKARGIPFLLTYDQWLEIWTASGHLHERGRHKGQYVMARFGDVGPYAVGNVEIVTAEENIVAAQYGKRLTTETREKIAVANIGKKHTVETKKLMSVVKRGNKYRLGKRHTAESIKRMSAARRGKPLSVEHREAISRGVKRSQREGD